MVTKILSHSLSTHSTQQSSCWNPGNLYACSILLWVYTSACSCPSLSSSLDSKRLCLSHDHDTYHFRHLWRLPGFWFPRCQCPRQMHNFAEVDMPPCCILYRILFGWQTAKLPAAHLLKLLLIHCKQGCRWYLRKRFIRTTPDIFLIFDHI